MVALLLLPDSMPARPTAVSGTPLAVATLVRGLDGVECAIGPWPWLGKNYNGTEHGR